MNMKSSVSPAVIFTALFGFVGLLLWLQFNISIETIEPDTATLSEPIASSTSSDLSTISAAPTSTPTIKPAAPASAAPATSNRLGVLRVSNQTAQPVRVALISRLSSTAQPTYSQPTHWDFAPREGNRLGLILSLPKDNLKLKKGDILVAFAQDGSRRYWGPYVVGETTAPTWELQASEWQLVLPP